MEIIKPIKENSYAIYGLGLSGKSTLRFLRKNKVNKIYTWDDNKKLKINKNSNFFRKVLNEVDFIVISPGIKVEKTKFKSVLIKNKKKIITDLDLFYMQKIPVKSIMITGTNGKSTTCKLIQHIFRTNKIDAQLGGNIGKPLLDLKIKKKTTVIIEASSFQLNYLKFAKPTFATILNISRDHIDWHRTFKNYQNSKFNIFSKQDKKDRALLVKKEHIKKFKKKSFRSKLIRISLSGLTKSFRNQITNKYLLNEPNLENVLFAYKISSIFNIKKKIILKGINTFKGLPHRSEVFYQKKGIIFINDSKATSFDASKYALKNNKNIFWIVGGSPKLGDTFKLQDLKKNIIKSYIIGKSINYFKKQINKTIIYNSSFTIEKALKDIITDLNLLKKYRATVLLSPASASYDQFNNFNERGNYFKKLTLKYARKLL